MRTLLTTRTLNVSDAQTPFYLVLCLCYRGRLDLHSVSQKNAFLTSLWSILSDQRRQLRVKSAGGRRSNSGETGPGSLPNTVFCVRFRAVKHGSTFTRNQIQKC